MKVLVTFALENEFAPWRAMREFRAGKWNETDAYFTDIGVATVGVVLTGVGSKHAFATVADIIWGSASIDCCISSGLAGGLRSARCVSEVIVAQSVSSDQVHFDVGSNILPCDTSLVSVASESGATVVSRIHTSGHAICTAEEKRALGERADAVEMESFDIVKEARAFGVRPVVIRAISDTVEENLPLDMNRVFNDGGQVSIPRVMGQVALHPQSLPSLVRLGRQSKLAAESLAQFMDRYVPAVVERAVTLGWKAPAVTQ